jgi:hypothetical protein
MQYVVLCLRWEVGFVGSRVIRYGYGGGTGVCLLSSFLLFSTKYVRYLMAFWWMSFMSILMLDFVHNIHPLREQSQIIIIRSLDNIVL